MLLLTSSLLTEAFFGGFLSLWMIWNTYTYEAQLLPKFQGNGKKQMWVVETVFYFFWVLSIM